MTNAEPSPRNPNPLAIGSWPSFCERAMQIAEEEARGTRHRLNWRIGRRLGLSEATARRITGTYPAIKAMTERTGKMKDVAKITFSSASIIAAWDAIDPAGATLALEEALKGMGSDALRSLKRDLAPPAAYAAPCDEDVDGEREAVLWTMALGSREVYETLKAMPEKRLDKLIELDERNGLGTARKRLTAKRAVNKRAPWTRSVKAVEEAEASILGAIRQITIADADTGTLALLKLASGRIGAAAVTRIADTARLEPSRCQAALQNELAAAERIEAQGRTSA